MNSICPLVINCLVILLFAKGYQSAPAKCPNPDEILPCICEEWDYPPTVFNCSLVTSNDELAQVFNREFQSTEFGKLYTGNNVYLKTIRAEDLGNASFTSISITVGILESVEPLAFSGSYETATTIMLFANALMSFPFEELPKFSVLESFGVDYNRIYSLPELNSDSINSIGFQGNRLGNLPLDALQGLPDINTADFRNGNITEILPGTFVGYSNLQRVDLAGNILKNLSSGTFQLNGVDSVLIISSNKLENIEVNAFSGVTMRVEAQSNYLQELPEEVWRATAEAGATLDLRYNSFVCGCDVAWLVLNPGLMAMVNPETACADGTLFIDLDPVDFEDC